MLTPTWPTLLHLFKDCFTAPARRLFEQLVTAWVLCPGRRTLTRLWAVIPPPGRRPYGAYARWLRDGKWSMDELWRRLLGALLDGVSANQELTLLLDDTLAKKTGREIEGAGIFRDPVLSTASYTVASWGLNLVIVALRVTPPWAGEPLALPILVRVHRKEKAELTLVELAATMVLQITRWLPDRRFRLVADGAYASLVGYELPRTVVVTRLRRNAALYELAPPRTGRRGRPRRKGARLPTPLQLAATVTDWATRPVSLRAKIVERQLWSRQILWYEAAGARSLWLVIVRDPAGRERDDFFVTTDIDVEPALIAAAYADRWAIEDTNRNVKQYLGAEDPQSWVRMGPERAVSLACWLYAMVWHWFTSRQAETLIWPDRPWYPSKRTPAFADALAALRRQIWGQAISVTSAETPVQLDFFDSLLTVLAEAA